MRASINNLTGLLIESSSSSTNETLISNAHALGYDDVSIIDVTDEDLAALIALRDNAWKTQSDLIADAMVAITKAIQEMLDTKAQSLRYDNIMSARSYAGFVNPFQQEALRLAEWAAACWVRAGEIQAEVDVGTRTQPTIDEILADLSSLYV